MEDQTLHPVLELIDSSSIDETEVNPEESEVKNEEVTMEVGDEDDEEFYERIEAPKFVDFTKPYTVRTDDCYWFCSRVGCDRKHEEEINPEEISKNFVLRVMAARSPNIKLRRALNKEHSSIKCPLSAPAKPSKPRIPRLATVPSLNSQKNGDPQSKIGSCLKAGSTRATPVAKSRQVAAKYMTTPRNKVCHPNPNSFRSVQNPKATTVDVAKSRTVAKALVFHSPKKAIVLKKSVESHTPLRKICEGMKRLGIASQKKTLKGSVSKPKKPDTEDSLRRQLKTCRSEKKSKDLAPSKSKTQNKKPQTDKFHSLHEQAADVKPSDEINDLSIIEDKENTVSAEDNLNEVKAGFESEQIDDGKENALNPHETSETSDSHASKAEINDLSNIEDKENMVSAEDHSNEVDVGFVSEQIDDGKENALNPQDNNRSNNQRLDDNILSKEIHKKNKVVQTAGPGVMKCKKPKPTSIKPFRLRTDERGILKEAILEKKLHNPAPKKEIAKDTSVIKRTYRVPKDEKFSTNCGKESGPDTARRRPESTQQRAMTSLKTRSQRVVSPKKVRMPGQQLGVIDEKSSKLPCDVTVETNKSRAVSAARSTSRGKRPVTVAKEPNFHTSHLPRTCSKNVA
ncbi:hypothetical protein HanXRQr2_Chr16g0751601 [Helianthus annuus]|uniref:Uncharacterized protein n=1 Tax=Helianthus annuus TaxID=4232 RepID=A0A251UM32_HELAN|nr:uncharacterized protein LOC110940195 [Helianthus annuus]KAF5760279.1 hypothetical protein HanXRQr2_Chr16g0751601 [Helianthus annuus]